jgi:hypothetical protein
MSGGERMQRASMTPISAVKLPGPKWRKPLPIPKHAHPIVRELYRQMNRQQTTMLEVAERSGLRRQTIWDWANRVNPRLSDLEAALNVLGFELAIREMDE